MENSEDLAEYVAKLEEAEFQLNDVSEDTLVEQIEDFLKGDGISLTKLLSSCACLICDVFCIYA